jgi:hypothetical protein
MLLDPPCPGSGELRFFTYFGAIQLEMQAFLLRASTRTGPAPAMGDGIPSDVGCSPVDGATISDFSGDFR